jgi:hypothetical protein
VMKLAERVGEWPVVEFLTRIDMPNKARPDGVPVGVTDHVIRAASGKREWKRMAGLPSARSTMAYPT